jgi:hypothetical protein
MRHEAHTGRAKYQTWMEFHAEIVQEFCLKNEAPLAVAQLETNKYYQGQQSVDEYINSF